MKFIDTAKLRIIAGKGGDGCVSFRREKFVPKGGPDGGNGGEGASVYFIGDSSRHTLMDFRYKTIYKAPDGEKGGGRDKNGKAGKDLILPVPLGTVVRNGETGEIIADILRENEPVLIAQGGRGGRGNMNFATPERRAPRIAEDGSPGEEIEADLELKLIADAGIIGFPNAGKSTFISVVSAAKPKIADYAFTTLSPNLGVVKTAGDAFVLADMPGLIENAHKGAGLGWQFLRHIERTRILLHFIDSSSPESMIERYETIREELSLYEENLGDRPEIVAASKFDAVHRENYEEFLEYAEEKGFKVWPVSSLTRTGTDALIKEISLRLATGGANDKGK